MYKSRCILFLLALVCFVMVLDGSQGSPVENDAQKTNSFQDFYDESSKKMSELLQQFKDTSEKNGWKDEVGKVMDKFKDLLNGGAASSP